MAHHSFAAEFDDKKPVKLEGTVVRFEFMNPFFIRLVKTVEVGVWCYVLYRGFQIIVY